MSDDKGMTRDEARRRAVEAAANVQCAADPLWHTRQEIAEGIVSAYERAMADAGWRMVPNKLMREAHTLMRETGWHTATAVEPNNDGVLEAAVSEVEAQFAAMLGENE